MIQLTDDELDKLTDEELLLLFESVDADIKRSSAQKYIDYNIVDTKLIKELDDKLKLIELNSLITYKAKCNHVDTLGTIKVWEAYLYNELLNKNLCLPPRKNHEKEDYPGAYVKEPKKGLYKNIVSFDFDSLYPLIMRQYNISPETFISHLSIDVDQQDIDECFFRDDFINPHPEYTVTGSGNYFKKNIEGQEGIVPVIIGDLFSDRKIIKKGMLQFEQEFENTKDKTLEANISQSNNEQMAIKILLNSLYGAMANKHFIFYDIRFARSITLSAQLATKFNEIYIENYKDLEKFKIKSIYCDTDSVAEDSVININNNKIKIKDFYDSLTENEIVRNENDFIKEIKSNNVSLSFDTKNEKIVNKRVKYIMKHKVRKKMYKIKYKDKEVKVTQDHSVIIKRNDVYISITPDQIKKGDKIVVI